MQRNSKTLKMISCGNQKNTLATHQACPTEVKEFYETRAAKHVETKLR
jgi:hypothetical protein